jgi:hypothetical protein
MIFSRLLQQLAAKYVALNPFPLRYNGFNATYLVFSLIDLEINQQVLFVREIWKKGETQDFFSSPTMQ